MDRRAELLETVEHLLEAGPYELVDVECVGGSRGMTVRVLIDKPGGLSIDDCARVSRAVGDHFESEGLFPGRYVLEVSSPGIDRPLRKPADFERFKGETVTLTTYEKVDGRNRHEGVLEGFDGEGDEVLVAGEEGETLRLPLGMVKKASLKRDPWEGLRRPKPKSRERKRKKKAR
jgi:ribosome maturation factor RimP